MDYNSNYVIMDEYKDTYNRGNSYIKKEKSKKNYWPIVFVMVIMITLSIVFVMYKNSYRYMERQLISRAKQYVIDNNLTIDNNYYLDVSKLKISLSNKCSDISGAIIVNEEYYPYLQCSDYESKIVENNSDKISLYGNSVVFLSANEKYVEPGFKSDYQVNVTNMIGSVAGIYQINYNVINNTEVIDKVQRLVIVKNSMKESMYPTISLIGENIIYLNIGDTYVEKGVVAFDNNGDNITEKVSISDNLDNNKEGEYTIFYKVENSKGYEQTITRKVIVVNNNVEEIAINYYTTPIGLTNDYKTIVMNISSKSYDYAILPNNEISKDSLINYDVFENGNYSFKIYDINGNEKIETIVIDYIDNINPIITCNAIIDNNGVSVLAVANDNYGISSYKYTIDGIETGEIIENNYLSNVKNAQVVSAMVKDLVGNVGSATCSIEDKRTPVSNYCTDNIIYEGTKYSLTESQKKKLAAMVQSEYGSDIVGMKMVASHMANLYEYKKWKGSTSKNFYGYISTTTWYSSGTRSDTKYSQNAMDAVIECIVNGHRTLPLYIDEFDWFPNDIKNAKKIEDYVIGQSEIRNVYGAVGKFWCVSQNSRKSDANIFFYTNDEYKNLVSE